MSESFKFVDRRRFTEEGDVREVSAAQEPISQKPVSQEKVVEGTQEKASPKNAGTVTFSVFIQSLAHQALMGLGIVPWPDSGLVQAKLEVASEMIDILGMLQEKTKGNLVEQEQKMLDGVLYELRMAYIQMSHGGVIPPTAPGAMP